MRLILSILFLPLCYGVIKVPDDYSMIQVGIDAAV